MGLLDQLWDDTVAGPRPENERGKLRKYSSFSFRPNSGKGSDGGLRSHQRGQLLQCLRFLVSSRNVGNAPDFFFPLLDGDRSLSGRGRESFRFRRRSTSDAYEKATETGPRSSPPSPYDV
ncbi:hypothetical protein L484_004927 [Morus notabilis]|uniref:Uncharacterized protein n=1 Tax=Morus notabilis TaxID=981085 RepID=W9RPM4_9ROSA|nr:hypothetical protein L484_004927 [Morus notabilis]